MSEKENGFKEVDCKLDQPGPKTRMTASRPTPKPPSKLKAKAGIGPKRAKVGPQACLNSVCEEIKWRTCYMF